MKGHKLDTPRRYAHTALVTFSGPTPFPLDMLRYDCCFPARGEDVATITESLERARTGNVPDDRLMLAIQVTRYTDSAQPSWTRGRWQSFGCQISHGSTSVESGRWIACSKCGQQCPAATAHLHQGQYIGHDCCWDDRLKATE